MHANHAHYWVWQKKCFIPYVRILHVNSLASIDTSVWMLKTFPGMLLFKCLEIDGISHMSSRVSWHFMTWSYECKEHPLMGRYSLVESRMVIPYDTIEGKHLVTRNLPVYHFSCSCLSKILLRRVLIQISVFVSLYELRHTQIVNSTPYCILLTYFPPWYWCYYSSKHLSNDIFIFGIQYKYTPSIKISQILSCMSYSLHLP